MFWRTTWLIAPFSSFPSLPSAVSLIIQASTDGHGVFAQKRFDDGPGLFLKMPLVGSFEVHDNNSADDSVLAEKRDGLPRVLVSDNMPLFLSENEVARPNAALYLVPAKISPVFYMHSLQGGDALEPNIKLMSVLTPRSFKGVEEKKAYLKNAMNSVTVDISCVVEKDTELLTTGFRSRRDAGSAGALRSLT